MNTTPPATQDMPEDSAVAAESSDEAQDAPAIANAVAAAEAVGAPAETAAAEGDPLADEGAEEASSTGIPEDERAPEGADPEDLEASSSAVTLESLDARIADLADLFKAKIEHSEYELEVARRYSEELQEYKGDLFRKITEPLLRGAIALAGGMRKAEDACIRRDEEAIALETFALYREELEDLLYDYGIASFTPQVGDPFVSGDHKIVGKGVPTSDPAKARTVAEVKGIGYRSGESVLAPARVCVFVLEEGAPIIEDASEAPASVPAAGVSASGDAAGAAEALASAAMDDGAMAVEAAAAQAIPVPAPRTQQEGTKPGIADTIPMPKADR